MTSQGVVVGGNPLRTTIREDPVPIPTDDHGGAQQWHQVSQAAQCHRDQVVVRVLDAQKELRVG